MKKALFYGFALMGIGLVAQTNTFPDTGKVGIGITNPLVPLDLVGAFGIRETASGLTNGDVRLYNHSGSTWGFIIRPFNSSFNGGTWDWNQDFGYRQDTKNWFVDTNFGVGVSNPGSKLHVFNGTSGKDPHGFSDLAVEDDDHGMISILTPSNKSAYYGFADTEDDFVGGMQYDHSIDRLQFRVNNRSLGDLVILSDGNVGIGTTAPDSELTVKGQIHALEVKVDLDGALAPDYVFYEDYDLRSLDEVQEHIQEHGHLPNIPSAAEIEKDGLHLKEMNLKLLEKVEELTLYTIAQQKAIAELKNELRKIEGVHAEIQELKKALQTSIEPQKHTSHE